MSDAGEGAGAGDPFKGMCQSIERHSPEPGPGVNILQSKY